MLVEGADRTAEQWPPDLATAAFMLARRFAAGATLWCFSPAWPQHAEHIAVEFVHPVIVGKRALPAVAVTDPDPVAALRALVRAGDVIAVVGGPGDPAAVSVLRRAPAWGAATIWVGAGRRPPPGAADHLIWCDEPSESPAFTGEMVLAYHVLWELTHVCFEHPGLLALERETCPPDVCITCADEGRVGEVMAAIGGGGGSAVAAGSPSSTLVRTAAGVEEVDTTLVDPLVPGDLVLVHAGVAISRLEEGSG
jgi:hypothetical protein